MFSRIDSKFWTDDKVTEMSPNARYLMMYLLTTPHRNMLGCYRLPKSYVMEDTGLTIERFTEAWSELLETGMVKYDDKTKMVLVCNFLKYNPIENQNQVKAAISKVEELHKTTLLSDIAEILVAVNKADGVDFSQLIGILKERAGIETVGVTLAERVTETSISKSISKSNSISNTQTCVRACVRPDNEENDELNDIDIGEDGFDEFWNAYPKKVGKAAALRAWKKIAPSKEIISRMISTIDAFKHSEQWTKESGRYIPNPTTWLAQGRWDDEILDRGRKRYTSEELKELEKFLNGEINNFRQ